jgi:predicted Ser/Thr protein kinase
MMDDVQRRKAKELYDAALACTPEERAELLRRSEPELKREVERMLAQDKSPLGRTAPTNPLGATATVFEPGMFLGRYEIGAMLGAGGMGQVFRARDTQLGRNVAIKTSNEMFRGRFETEARAISALNHPHICTLYDAGRNYLVMELVEGQSLAARLKEGPLPREEVLRYAIQIAGALAEAHSHGIIHRDLKPSNIMLTRHGVKVLDFGLAKMLGEPGITETRAIVGTPAYMAPEQVLGDEPSAATDLFAFGLVLYEMAAGKLPIPGASLGLRLASGIDVPSAALSEQRPDMPGELDGLIRRLIEKDPAQRPQTADEVARQLKALAEPMAGLPADSRWRPALTIGAAIVVVMSAAGAWLYHGIEQRRWAREVAIPQATAKTASGQPLAGYVLLRQAGQILKGDPQVASIEKSATEDVSIRSEPEGAKVEIQDYVKSEPWFTVGTTPLTKVRVPKGYFRWKVTKPGVGEYVSAQPEAPSIRFPLAAANKGDGMVPVPAGAVGEFVDFIGWITGSLPAFSIDKFEVTNAQYQQFVDQGGYRDPKYWNEEFVKDGKRLRWQEAMDLFRDPTGRPGPSTWEAGHYPPGKANYPVSGVSWYEAAAYAVFTGKSLPTLIQWYDVAPGDTAAAAAAASNFNEKGPAPVGSFPGVGPYGTYDMVGNVREWTVTESEGSRFILGGAWGTQAYQAFDPEGLPPFDRSPMNGFRTVKNEAPLPAAALAPVVRRSRDFSKEKPASDEVFQAYKGMYAYDKKLLNATDDGVVEETPDWSKRKVTIDAGYEGQRLPMYLFLPKHVDPPFQAILFFPSARVEMLSESRHLGDLQFMDYAIKSGRALLYPIYNGTYERVLRALTMVGAADDLQMTIQRSKEVRRAVDYLVSRPDIDASRLAYLGVSMGSAYGVIFTALEDRFRAIVFLDGGFFLGPAARGRDQLDFAPRVTKPVLMVNGRYDFTFSPDRSQDPLFRLLGTPPADKRHVVLDTPHNVSQQKGVLSREVLAWLDKYLGRVN